MAEESPGGQQVTREGDWTTLDLKEIGASGRFQVMAIEPCPEIESGTGRIVTGIFRHNVGVVNNLWTAGNAEPIGVTDQHPFWSVDRKDWIPACELRFGERLLICGSTTIVERFETRGYEPVYNLEVDADHCYRVGEQGILVHNASVRWRALNRADQTRYDSKQGLIPKGKKGTVLEHIRQGDTKYISISLTEAGTNHYKSGNGVISIDLDKLLASGSTVIPHDDVVKIAEAGGRDKDVTNVVLAEEELVIGGIPFAVILCFFDT